MRYSPNNIHYWHVGGSVEGRTAAGGSVPIRNPGALLAALTHEFIRHPRGPGRDYLRTVCVQLADALILATRWQRAAASNKGGNTPCHS